jgi:quinol monooxygenase YgiN
MPGSFGDDGSGSRAKVQHSRSAQNTQLRWLAKLEGNMIVFTMKMKALPEKRRELVQALPFFRDATREFDGCLSCEFYEGAENKSAFVLVSEWETQANLESFLKSDKFSALMGVRGLLRQPHTVTLDTVTNRVGMDAVEEMRSEPQ